VICKLLIERKKKKEELGKQIDMLIEEKDKILSEIKKIYDVDYVSQSSSSHIRL
jgi:hypothetical protein